MPDLSEDNTDLSLAAEFPPASHETWLKLLDKILGGAPFDKKLVSRTYDGLEIQPLYTRGHWNGDGDPSGLPGGAPYVRGSTVLGNHGGWDIRQLHHHPDPKAANRQILEDLERGATSIALRTDPSGEDGVCMHTLADMEVALKDVLLDLAPVCLDPSAESIAVAAMLMEVLARRSVNADAFTGNFGLDPIGILATTGTIPGSAETALGPMADMAAHVARAFPKARALNVFSTPYHSAGCTQAQELGFVIATATEYLRELTAAGLSVDAACNQIAFTVTADTDQFLAIGKIRALRRLWARITEASGASVRTAPIAVRTAPRMMSRRDPWVNILRTTMACFAAGVAGAESITVLPFDHAIGLPRALARRVARNTQIVLQEESGLARVIDPAGGAWLFETLTDDLAAAGWAVFQKIESQSGMLKALMSGGVADDIAAVRSAVMKTIARRKDQLTGVSEFPDIGETMVSGEDVDLAAILKAREPIAGVGLDGLPPPADGPLASAIRAAVKGGAPLMAIDAAFPLQDKAAIPPLPQIRLGQEFERLRDASDAFADKYGQRPSIFLANIGTIAEFSARAGFARNMFEAGGIAAVAGAGDTDVAAIAEDFKLSKIDFAVICSTDALYGEHAAALAKMLRSAGASMIFLAGHGGDNEIALREAGVDDFIYMGCDVIAALDTVHGRLEAP